MMQVQDASPPEDFMFTYIPLFTNDENEPYIRSSNLLWDLALEESTMVSSTLES